MIQPNDEYLGAADVPVAPEETLDGAPFMARVHFGLIEGRAQCVGLEVRAFVAEELDTEYEGETSAVIHPLPGWQPLTSRRLRALKLDSLIEKARPLLLRQLNETADHLRASGKDWFDSMALAATEGRSSALGGRVQPPRRGRPTLLSHQDLAEIVARTYNEHLNTGGRKPVQAVQAALQDSASLPGNGPDGSVTDNQARAAVRRARAAGLLAPVTRKTGETT